MKAGALRKRAVRAVVRKLQRCRVHFMSNLLAHVPQRDKSMIAALVRMVFAQPDREAADQ